MPKASQEAAALALIAALYLPGEVDGRSLGDGAVHLSQHLTQLRHHGGKIIQEGLHRFLKDGTDRLWEKRDCVSSQDTSLRELSLTEGSQGRVELAMGTGTSQEEVSDLL